MGKIVNYLREYREIKVLEARRRMTKALSAGVSSALFLTAYYSNIKFFGILAPCLLTHAALATFYYSQIKRRTGELGFDSIKDFRECIEGARECLEIRGVPDELMGCLQLTKKLYKVNHLCNFT